MAGEWEFRAGECKGTNLKAKDQCPTLVADSLTPSVFKSSLCLSEKSFLSQERGIAHPWGEGITLSAHTALPAFARRIFPCSLCP